MAKMILVQPCDAGGAAQGTKVGVLVERISRVDQGNTSSISTLSYYQIASTNPNSMNVQGSVAGIVTACNA